MSQPASSIKITAGNIVDEAVDAIVNAANEALISGGGVDGAIARAAGPGLEVARRALGGCAVGEAKYTLGFNLKANYIIHTVAPRYFFSAYDTDKRELLARCYENSLNLAKSLDVKSIAFPALGTGAYGWPHEEAAPIAIHAITKWQKENANYGLQVKIILAHADVFVIYNTKRE